jgi:hypothetical protein
VPVTPRFGRTFLVRDIEGVRPKRAIVRGCELMSAGMEVAINECVRGEEVLSLPRRFEPLHLPFSLSCRSM